MINDIVSRKGSVDGNQLLTKGDSVQFYLISVDLLSPNSSLILNISRIIWTLNDDSIPKKHKMYRKLEFVEQWYRRL